MSSWDWLYEPGPPWMILLFLIYLISVSVAYHLGKAHARKEDKTHREWEKVHEQYMERMKNEEKSENS